MYEPFTVSEAVLKQLPRPVLSPSMPRSLFSAPVASQRPAPAPSHPKPQTMFARWEQHKQMLAPYFRDPAGPPIEEQPAIRLIRLDLTIRALYVRLRHYGEAAKTDPAAEQAYQRTLALLRQVQHRETKLMPGERDRRVDWRPGEGREAMEEAERLITAHAHLAPSNSATGSSDR